MNSNSNQNLEENENLLEEDSINKENNKKQSEDINGNENSQKEGEINHNKNIENNLDENVDEPIYVMTLALEHGKSEKIEIFADSDPAKLAYDFCSKNNLDFNALDYLKEQITNLLESYNKSENEEINNEDINIAEIEEANEEQEFNITDNYEENKSNSESNIEDNIINDGNNNNFDNNNNYRFEEIDFESFQNQKRNSYKINDKNQNNRNFRKNVDLSMEKEEIQNNLEFNKENNNIDTNLKEGNIIINNPQNEEKNTLIMEENEKLDINEMSLVNRDNMNRTKKRNYKINEDIIIGIGDNENKINSCNKLNENSDKKKLENIYNKNVYKGNKKIYDQFLTNNFNQETKTNTNNNIIQNEEEENNNIYSPKNELYIYNKKKENKIKEKKINYKKVNKINIKEKIPIRDKRSNKTNITKNNNNNSKNTSMRIMKKIKEEYNNEYRFKPVINNNYKTDLNFNERLNLFNNISKIKKEELKNNLSTLKDKENGQDFFKPKLISRQLSFTKNTNKKEDIDIFNKNYLYWEKYNLNKKNLYNKFYQKKAEPKIYSKLMSEKIINETNRKTFCNLFNLLDSDQDNLITSFSINLNNIPKTILKIIEHLLIELKEDNQTLNQEEFIKAMYKLFENIPFSRKRELISEFNKNNIKTKISLFNHDDKLKQDKKIANKNTNKLAEKHYLKMQKMMNIYNIKKNRSLYTNSINSSHNKIFCNNKKFSFINDCTFNNYLKNLN